MLHIQLYIYNEYVYPISLLHSIIHNYHHNNLPDCCGIAEGNMPFLQDFYIYFLYLLNHSE